MLSSFMGNYRLRLADLVSNGCLYKLREMGRARSQENSKKKQHPAPPPPPPRRTTATTSSLSAAAIARDARQFSPRKSYYITRELVHDQSPRKSSKQRHMRRTKSPNRSPPTLVSSSSCSCHAAPSINPGSPPGYAASPASCSPVCWPVAEFRADCALSTNHERVPLKPPPCRSEADEPSESGEFPELVLRPIITKAGTVGEVAGEPKKTRSVWVNRVREEKSSSQNPRRRSVSVSSPGVKLRVNSPKLGRRLIMQRKSGSWRRSLGQSTAVVKSSVDPKKDFRESMVEMIKANNIRGSKDLEELLACYLSLNSEEYHNLIINVFKQIWFDLNHLPACLPARRGLLTDRNPKSSLLW